MTTTHKLLGFAQRGLLCSIASCTFFFAPRVVDAEIVIDIAESNGSVIAELSGSLDFNGLTPFTFGVGGFNGLDPSVGAISFAGNGEPVDPYRTADRLTPFGTSGFGNWDTQSGDPVAFFNDLAIGVPPGYVSGDPLAARAVKFNATLSSFGLTPGYFRTNFSSGGFSDSLTINVVPEPSSVVVSLAIAGTLSLHRRPLHRRRYASNLH